MNLSATNVFRSVATECTEFLRWWLVQLVECARWLLGYVAPHWQQKVVVVFDADGGAVLVNERGRLKELFNFHADSAGHLPSDLHRFGSVEVIKDARCEVGFSENLVLKRIVPLPDSAERQLASVLALYLEREFPVALNLIAWCYSVKSRTKANKRIDVEIAIVRRADLQRIEQAMRDWGLKATRIGVMADDRVRGEFRVPVRPSSFKFAQLHRVLLLSAASLGTIAVGCVMGQWIYERHQIGLILEPSMQKAKSVQQLSRKVEREAQPAQELANIASQPDAADLVYLLTERTPADTWVYQLNADMRANIDKIVDKEPALIIGAVTPASLSYLKTLAAIPGFDRVEMASAEPNPGNTSVKRVLIKVHAVRLASGYLQ